MRTIDFLWRNINADAKLTFAKQNGDIILEGTPLDMNWGPIDCTEVVGVALGECGDLIITVKEN